MKVSLICACKNRNKPLEISLKSWLLFDEIKEIIIVDWSSDESLDYLANLDSRIKIVTVPNKKYFNQPQPLNLAASLATGDSIMKFDIDYIINPYWNFFEAYPIDDNTFVSGTPNYKSPEYIQDGVSMVSFGSMDFNQIFEYCNVYSPYFKSLIGLLHITRKNFIKCGGYSENLGEFYGFEDEELQTRLELMGLNHSKLNFDHTLIHIPHPDSKRIEYFEGSTTHSDHIEYLKNNLAQYYSGDTLKHQLEYAIAQFHIQKNKENFSTPDSWYNDKRTKWDVKKIDDQHYIATEFIEMNKLENFPPVYYVTLEECVDRQKQIESEFASYGIVPNAIKSKRFSESNDVITGKYVHQLTGPTQGCIVSHLKAIKKWYESEESDYAFFCEDDLSLKTVQYWNFNWEEFIERLPDDCECVQLMSIRGDFDGVYFRDRKWDDWSETAYIIDRDYAKKLIDNYCIGDSFHLELKHSDIMPIGENILFTGIGKVYTFPMFVESVDIPTTDVNDLELENGQKPNHVYASEYVHNWWKKNGETKSIDDLMGTSPIKKTFVLMDEEDSTSKHNVVDCFMYFNEKELLELRINLLKDYVDKFVIVDSNYTHSGVKKDYSCKKVIKELGLPEEMIEVIEVDLSDENVGDPTEYEYVFDQNPEIASRERLQRDALVKCLETNNFDEDTVFIVSDCDEIINPKNIAMMSSLARTNRDKIFKCDLVNLEGRSDLRSYAKDTNEPKEWRYSLFFCLKEHIETMSLTHIRAAFNLPYVIVWPYTEGKTVGEDYIPGERIKDLGWHFTWMGTNENRLLKSKSLSNFNSYLSTLVHGNYSSTEMIEYISNYDINDLDSCPSGDIFYYLDYYPTDNLPQIIFDLPRVKKYLLPTLNQTNMRTELEQLLYEFSLDTENAQLNFNLGLWYEREGHTAPALSYFLRCAERASDDTFAYEALLKSHHCYDKQGTRDGTAISLLQQAICLSPKRPEAYFLLARFHEKRSQWNDSYKYASLGLSICDFDLGELTSNVEYPGKYGLLYEKAISGWWWGKSEQSRQILKSLIFDYDLTPEYKESVIENLKKIKGEVPVPSSSETVLVEQSPSSFRFGEEFDWGEMTYDHIITIDREIAHENVYGFWRSVNENDVVMDVGASVGPFIYSILDNKPKKVYCVEPSLSLMKTLAKNCAGKLLDFKENPLVYVNKAIISSEEDDVNIFGSIPNFEKTTFKKIVDDYNIDRINFLKIDCEGGEYSIFSKENMDFLIHNVDFVAMEVHLNYDGYREKFKTFRDECLTKFSNYKVISCTRQPISWGNNVDLSKKIFDNDFIDNYTCEFMIYISNR